MTALVVGGTTGFGRSIGECLLGAGYRVITVGRTDADIVCDVGNEDEVRSIWSRISQEPPLDIIVFVVGYARLNSVGHSESDWQEHEQKNMGYVKQMLENIHLAKQAKIVTVGSQWSWRRNKVELAPYIESKHALRVYTEDFARRHPEFSVVHMCPPTMRTPQLVEVMRSGYVPPSSVIADPELIAVTMVNEIISKDFHGETIQFDAEGKPTIIHSDRIEREPVFRRGQK